MIDENKAVFEITDSTGQVLLRFPVHNLQGKGYKFPMPYRFAYGTVIKIIEEKV